MHLKKRDGAPYRTVFIGAGPAGIGPLVCAVQKGTFAQLLDSDIAVLDATNIIGRGAIGQYVINSDTLSNTFLECLRNQGGGPLAPLLTAESTHAIQQHADGPAPLRLVGDYMADLGQAVRRAIDAHPASQFLARTTAQSITLNRDGTLTTHARWTDDEGSTHMLGLQSTNVVVATGGVQSLPRVLSESVAGVPLSNYASKLMLTGTLLSVGGIEEVQRRLRDANNRKIVIVGGSHSAFSSAWVLLNQADIAFDEGDITLLHREKLKLFYASKEAAWAEGYTDFNDDDICPLTGRVYRLGGFRFDSRDLLMQVWGINGRQREKRINLVMLDDNTDASCLKQWLDEAALIVPAFGYRPIAIDVRDADGNAIDLMCRGEGAPPMVDKSCRVLAADGQPIPGVFGIGLASGFVPTGKLGGEPSFRGQTNGLWLYQNGVGEIILDQILQDEDRMTE